MTYEEKARQRVLNLLEKSYDKDKCWIWKGCIERGYGKIFYKGKSRWVHRVIYELFIGEIGDLDILHRCDVKNCGNPQHLEKGTHQKNIQDAIKRNLCVYKSGENSRRAILTQKQVTQIRLEYIPRIVTLHDLGKKYNVSYSTIYDIISFRSWR